MKFPQEVNRLIEMALREDIGKRDITTELCIPKGVRCRGKMIFREKAVAAGLGLLPYIFKKLDHRVKVRILAKEGSTVGKNRLVATLVGPARSILTGERTVLNFVTHLSGVATLTRSYVEKVKPYRAQILATRKTTPGLRFLEKSALRAGGGDDHRMGLYDQILVKENHLEIRSKAIGRREDLKSWTKALKKKTSRGIKIEVEAQSLSVLRQLLASPVDIILLDNLPIPQIHQAVLLRNQRRKRPLLGVSGGVTLKTVRAVAKTGVERISVGRLTHSAPAINISIDIDRVSHGTV